MKLMIINGSVREARRADTILAWATEILKPDTELEFDVVDLKQVDLPFFNEAVTPSANGGKYQNPKATAWSQRVSQAEAFLFITPEYNHGPTAVLKNAVDWLYNEWRDKPAGFISYGGAAAGTRAVQQLKLNLMNVNVFPVNNNVHIPLWGGGVDENGRPQAHFDETLCKLIVRLKELQRRLKD